MKQCFFYYKNLTNLKQITKTFNRSNTSIVFVLTTLIKYYIIINILMLKVK
jgi:hypothetical protein